MFNSNVALATALITAMASFAYPHAAHAQSDETNATRDASPSRDRIDAAHRVPEARKADSSATQATANAARYPQATRAEPPAKASAGSTPTLKKMLDAYNANDPATVTALADAVIADPQANAYDHAFAARMGGVVLLRKDPKRAMQYLTQALQFNGLPNNDHYESMSLLAQLQLQAEQYTEGLSTLDRFFAETHSLQPEQLALKGNALYRLKRYTEAEAALKQAIATSPQSHPDWMQLLMATYVNTNQQAEAARIADELVAKTPNDRKAQLNLATAYMRPGSEDKAVAILEKLRASGQLTDEKDYRNLYSLYFNLKDKDRQAVEVINEGLQKGILKPDYQTYSSLAQGYYFSGQNTLAIDAYMKAAPLAPDGETYLNLAKALSNEGRAAEAKQAALKALDKGVKSPAEAKRIAGQKSK